MEHAEITVAMNDPVSRERERLVSSFRNVRPGLAHVLSVIDAALESKHSDDLFIPRAGQPSLDDMREELVYLQQHASDRDLVNQELYRVKLSRLLHSVSVALAQGS